MTVYDACQHSDQMSVHSYAFARCADSSRMRQKACLDADHVARVVVMLCILAMLLQLLSQSRQPVL